MRIDATHLPGPSWGSNAAHRRAASPPAAQASGPKPVDQAEPSTASSDSKGVLRLLEAGHFKGVADVRLRINFADQIAERQAAKVAETTDASLANVQQAISAEIDALTAGAGLDESQQAAVADALASFDEATAAGRDSIVAGDATPLQDAFSTLTTALRSILQPVDVEPATGEPAVDIVDDQPVAPDPADAPAPSEAGESQPSDAAAADVTPTAEPVTKGGDAASQDNDPLASLVAAFDAAVEQLIEDQQTVSVLPPLSEPSGRGTAYDKFLAIYESLNAPSAAEDDATLGPVLDQVA